MRKSIGWVFDKTSDGLHRDVDAQHVLQEFARTLLHPPVSSAVGYPMP